LKRAREFEIRLWLAGRSLLYRTYGARDLLRHRSQPLRAGLASAAPTALDGARAKTGEASKMEPWR